VRRQGKKLAKLVRLWASKQLLIAADHDENQATVNTALAAWGLQIDGDTPAQAEPDTFWIWPESLPVWALWQRLQTMWRISMAGRDGLDWASVTAWLERAERIRHPRRLADTLHCLRAMESAALDVWATEREKQTNKG